MSVRHEVEGLEIFTWCGPVRSDGGDRRLLQFDGIGGPALTSEQVARLASWLAEWGRPTRQNRTVPSSTGPAAWLVVYINMDEMKAVSAQIVSEATPSVMGSLRTAVVEHAYPEPGHEAHEFAFSSARKQLLQLLGSPMYRWVVPLLSEDDRKEVRVWP